MMLVDTSVWVNYFRPAGEEVLRAKVIHYLQLKQVVTTPMVRSHRSKP